MLFSSIFGIFVFFENCCLFGRSVLVLSCNAGFGVVDKRGFLDGGFDFFLKTNFFSTSQDKALQKLNGK